jgi:hypothetical protein
MPGRASARRVREANRSHSRSMARMSDKAIGDAGCVEHSEIYGWSYQLFAGNAAPYAAKQMGDPFV